MKSMKLFSSITVLFCLLSCNSLYSQGAYVSVNAGYGESMSSQNLEFIDFYNYNSSGNSFTEEQVFVSLGKGVNLGGSFGYMFNKNIGAELGLSYLVGGQSTAKDDFSGGTTDYTLSSNMLRIIPSLVISSGMEKVNPYARFGLVLGTGSVKYEVESREDGDLVLTDLKMNGGLAVGLHAAIGAIFSLNDKVSLFGEINMINMSYAPTQGEITKASFNGVDQLPMLTTSQKEVEFVDSYTSSFGNPPPESLPSKELKQKLPFGSIGLNVGLRISL